MDLFVALISRVNREAVVISAVKHVYFSREIIFQGDLSNVRRTRWMVERKDMIMHVSSTSHFLGFHQMILSRNGMCNLITVVCQQRTRHMNSSEQLLQIFVEP